MNTIAEIAAVIKKFKSALIFTHMRPDGDTVGCALALREGLLQLGIPSEVLCEGEIPEKLKFLAGAELVRSVPSTDMEGYICVDTSDTARLGELHKLFLQGERKGKTTVNFDHHISNTRYAKYNFVRERSSNCENMSELLHALGVTFNERIANALMTGLVTDSGGFSHSDVNGETFRIAGEAADCGADVVAINYEVFKRQTKGRAKMYAEVISTLRYELGGALGISVIPAALLKKYGLKQDSTEGIVDFALTVDCVEVSACIMEVGREQYKISLRSKGKVNVNEVARKFGGGGHVLASGCMLFGLLEEVVEKISYAVAQAGNL